MRIDPKSGTVTSSSGEVLFNPSAGEPLPESINGSYPARPIHSFVAPDGVRVTITLWNIQGRAALEFFASHPSFGTDWNDWSQSKEEQRVEWLKALLKKAGVNTLSYGWGRVSAQYDPKSAAGSAWVSYEAQPTVQRDVPASGGSAR